MGPTSKRREKGGRGEKGSMERGREEGEGKKGKGKRMEGKNVLPHVKQAVAAYAGMVLVSACLTIHSFSSGMSYFYMYFIYCVLFFLLLENKFDLM